MVDSSGLFNLKGQGVPDVFEISAISLMVILIADLGFTGFRQNLLGVMVTGFLFIITIISFLALSKNTIYSDGHILDGALGFTIGTLVFMVIGGVTGAGLSLLSTASNSYLAGVLGTSASTVVPMVNTIFAPIGETLLIFGLASGVNEVVKHSRFKDSSALTKLLLIGTIPSIIFGSLHGAASLQLLAKAFLFNMFWSALLVYGAAGKIDSKFIPAGLGLVAGLHFSHNALIGGGVVSFVSTMVAALGTEFARSAAAILGFLFLMWGLGVVRFVLILREKEVV